MNKIRPVMGEMHDCKGVLRDRVFIVVSVPELEGKVQKFSGVPNRMLAIEVLRVGDDSRSDL